jgi:NAD(P)H-dependent flavin oxidoreductase YrpB (nitropropane dioxygenase family)
MWPTRSAGQVAGLIHEILPVRTVMESMVREAQTILRGLADLLPE